MSKNTLITEIANNLVSNKKTMTYDQLATHLNDIGHKTTYGTRYTGSRGVSRLISSVFKNVKKEGDIQGANNISKAFTNSSGTYPWM